MAPEIGIARLLFDRYRDKYVPVDINPDGYKSMPAIVQRFDMARPLNTFEPNSVSALIHCHVLEHIFAPVSDVILQLNQMVLPGGFHIFQIPIRSGLYAEDLDPSLTAEQREERFGQGDHVRWFGDQDIHASLLSYFTGFDRIELANIVDRDELLLAGVPEAALTQLTSHTLFAYQKLA